MNYLAHIYLAGEQPDAIVGNLMGDFVKGRLTATTLAPALLSGINLHRKIDTYTDTHPLFRQSKQRLRPELRRYSGILVDIFYDHFLVQHWSCYSAQPLREFIDEVYALLRQRYALLPERMQRSIHHMLANDLLMSYRELAGIERALQGLERRLKRPSQLAAGVLDLQACYAELESDFSLFFPQLIAFVEHYNASMESKQ